MTKIKLCGMMRECDIRWANACAPDYIGFIFWEKSRRNIEPEKARAWKAQLDPKIKAVGVFVDAPVEHVAWLLDQDIIDVAQLHGKEDEDYIRELRKRSTKPIIKAFKIHSPEDVAAANASSAELVLVDSGTGSGKVFDWQLLKDIRRPYLLAGGLHEGNIAVALSTLHPYGVDVSSGIETDGVKDEEKMARLTAIVRKEVEA